MTDPASRERLSLGVAAGLALAAILVNADRFWLGAAGPQRAHDGADFFLTTLVACGRFWTSPLAHQWNASILRGWPVLYGTIPPQYLGCMFGGALPAAAVWPALQVVILATLAIGSFWFLRLVLGFPPSTALTGALLNVALFYWTHEHDMVMSAVLLPSLVGILALSGGWRIQLLRAVGLFTVIGLSNPPNILIIMPLAHLALIALVAPEDRGRHVRMWTGFWAIYGLYYGPTLVAYATHAAQSSRALFGSEPGGPLLPSLIDSVRTGSRGIVPAIVLVPFVTRRTLRATMTASALLAGIYVFSSLNAYFLGHSDLARNSAILALSTMYYRLRYFDIVIVFLWGATVIRHADIEGRWFSYAGRAAAALVLAEAAHRLMRSGHSAQTFRYAVWMGAGLILLRFVRKPAFAVACVASLVFVAPLRLWFTADNESPFQGNVFIEQPVDAPTAFRSVTVMRTCDASDIFPAQAAMAGRETLNGNANIYDRGFAERWRYFVTDGSQGCTRRYAGWNNRAEVTPDDLARAPDRILLWFWVNGVDEIRSPVPLEHPSLTLTDARTFDILFYGGVTRYRYRAAAPLGRVFTVAAGGQPPESVVGDLDQEYHWLRDVRVRNAASSVALESYSDSRLTFSGTFDPDALVLASINAHAAWRLYIDERRADERIAKGPLGMLALHPLAGAHRYTLAFEDPFAPWALVCLAAALLALVYSGREGTSVKRSFN